MRLYELTFRMAQPQTSEISETGAQFASEQSAKTPSVDRTIDSRDDIEDDDDSRGVLDQRWMEISDERREELLKEADIYLAELAEKVGEPSPKHIARAKALVKNINAS